MKISKKLEELGFKKIDLTCYSKTVKFLGDRFTYTFVYDIEENNFYIHFLGVNGYKTKKEKDFLINHNLLATGAVGEWNKIKEELKEFDFNVY